MALIIHPSQAYALLAGLYIGKFTNIFSDVVITGLVLYIVTPEIFTENRLNRIKNYFWSWFRPQPVNIELNSRQKIMLLENKKTNNLLFDLKTLPKIEIIQSPKPVTQYKNKSVKVV